MRELIEDLKVELYFRVCCCLYLCYEKLLEKGIAERRPSLEEAAHKAFSAYKEYKDICKGV